MWDTKSLDDPMWMILGAAYSLWLHNCAVSKGISGEMPERTEASLPNRPNIPESWKNTR